ncbi:MAG: TetR/AcrR family transcriptional regulator [Gammaproteobacteria bacterium]|nr:TetR/AcrR family transcriptional regulator [Gammaproteobacteria bacterium]
MTTPKAQATRDRILEAASRLFYQYGFHATGLDKILLESGVTKGNFYYHFKSKEALALATLDWQFETIANGVSRLRATHVSALDTLLAILDFFTQTIANQKKSGGIFGCYFGNFTLELSNENPAVRTRLREIFSRYHETFRDLLQQAVSAGELPALYDPEQLAAVTLSLLEGAIVVDKAHQEPKEVYRAVAFMKAYLKPG